MGGGGVGLTRGAISSGAVAASQPRPQRPAPPAGERGLRRPRAVRFLAWAGILAVFVALRIPYVATPLERDEGAYAYVAQRALRGEVPYRDAFDHKPPGVYLVYASFFATTGESVASIHLGMYLWTLAGTALLYRLVARRAGAAAGLAAALAQAVLTIDPAFLGNAANTEIFMIVPLTGALLCLCPQAGAPGRGRVFAAGALGAAAFWLKPVAATNIAFLAAWLVWLRLRAGGVGRARRAAADLGWLALGGAAATAPVIGYFAAHGALRPFAECVFAFNSAYATVNSPPVRLVPAIFWEAFRAMIPALWPYFALAALGLAELARRTREDAVMFAGWLAASAAGVCVGGYFREHYFIQAVPAVAALAGLAVAWLDARLAPRGAAVRAGALAAVVAAMVLVPAVANRATACAGSPALVARAIYGRNPFDYSQAIAAEVARISRPDETVFIVGSESQILFYADRRSASRFIYLSPLAAPPYPGRDRALRATLAEVERARPRVVVDASRIETSLLAGPGTDAAFFRALQATLAAQGLRPESFFKAVPAGAAGRAGETYEVVDPEQVLAWERSRGARETGVMVLRRPDLPD